MANVDVPVGVFGYRSAVPSSEEHRLRMSHSGSIRSVMRRTPVVVREQWKNADVGAAFLHACAVVGSDVHDVDDLNVLSKSRSLWVAARYLKAAGAINYRVVESRGDAILHALQQGPVVVGSNWTRGMMTPDRDGVVAATGAIVGRHAWCAIGYNGTRELVRAMNSWGVTWGQVGRFWIARADLDRLVSDGDACLVLAPDAK